MNLNTGCPECGHVSRKKTGSAYSPWCWLHRFDNAEFKAAYNARNLAAQAARRADDPDKVARIRRAHWLSRYRITAERFAEMLAEQGGVCLICLRPPDEGETFHVDHDHRCCPKTPTCGKCNRAILCGTCNKGLGCFKDDPTRLERALIYMRCFSGKSPE